MSNEALNWSTTLPKHTTLSRCRPVPSPSRWSPTHRLAPPGRCCGTATSTMRTSLRLSSPACWAQNWPAYGRSLPEPMLHTVELDVAGADNPIRPGHRQPDVTADLVPIDV